MGRRRSWTDEQLVDAVGRSLSIRAVIGELGLIPAGGNYVQVQRRIAELGLDVRHFTGRGWYRGWKSSHGRASRIENLHKVLVRNSSIQSHALKLRLFMANLKQPRCELCGWCEVSVDGRIPVELDHINGQHTDNRLENLRILCPNCHSLQITHRGRNKKVLLTKISADGVTGSHERLKIS